MKKRFGRLSAFLLAVCLCVSGASGVMADKTEDELVERSQNESDAVTQPKITYIDQDGTGRTIQVILENYQGSTDVTDVMFAVWSEKSGQDDLIWHSASNENGVYTYALNTDEHNDDLGVYWVHAYARKTDGTMQMLLASSCYVERIERTLPEVQTALDASENYCDIQVSDYLMPFYGESLMVAVWSTTGGQDDLTWNTLQRTGSTTYQYTCAIREHRTAGEYQAHVYLRRKTGEMQLLAIKSFTVSGSICQNVRVEEIDQANGRCRVSIEGVSAPSGIQKVLVPVWSRPDQSDIVWYTAAKVGNNYQVDMNVANHGYNTGKYQIHVYTVSGNQIQENKWQANVEFYASEASVSASATDTGYRLEATSVEIPGGTDKVQFAVWSEVNGQDDLKWHAANYQKSSRSAIFNLALKDYRDFGRYQVHAYAQSPNGKMTFLGSTVFQLQEPSANKLDISVNNEQGKFTITIGDINCAGGIQKIMVPVWNASDQSDIVWYQAVKNSEGEYVVNSDISKHQYHLGNYQVHVYLYDVNGFVARVNIGNMTFSSGTADIRLVDDPEEILYHVIVEGVNIPAGPKRVMMAAWSAQNGQDDICWYTAAAGNSNTYEVNVDIRNHKTLGKYYVHVYAETWGGQMIFLGEAKGLAVEEAAVGAISVSNRNESEGTFDVTINVTGSASGVSTVQVPVWCAGDQSDIVWYTAQKKGNAYTVTVNVSNHKGNLGTYKINSYITMGNGIVVGPDCLTYDFNPANFLCVLNDSGRGSRRVVLKNVASNISKVMFPVWSDTSGQDDIVWYTAVKNAEGTWEAVIYSRNHKDSGTFRVHAYVNDQWVRATSFNFPASEFSKNGWYYENGYKLYYQNDQLVTDVSGIIGPQSEYLAKINRVTCTVTIYAKDGDNGFIIPVKVFTCSVGLPGTETPLGTYHTLAKYRWHELMGPSYGQYCTRIVGGILFHSVAGYNMTSYNLSAADYNMLGSPASHGCVRLCVRDAKWIYDNCGLGMAVVIYDSADPGPFGKPATIKIPAGQTWDPTDPNI